MRRFKNWGDNVIIEISTFHYLRFKSLRRPRSLFMTSASLSEAVGEGNQFARITLKQLSRVTVLSTNMRAQ